MTIKSKLALKNLDNQVIFEIAKKYNISYTAAKIICQYPFRFVKEVMRKKEMKNIHFIYFGKFAVKPTVRKLFEQNMEIKRIKDRKENIKDVNQITKTIQTNYRRLAKLNLAQEINGADSQAENENL
jgi:hypothetical protein